MYTNIVEQLAHQRARDLRGQAEQARHHVARTSPRNSIRHRAGWTLVQIGLRLVSAAPDE